jgi:hypothetical protein
LAIFERGRQHGVASGTAFFVVSGGRERRLAGVPLDVDDRKINMRERIRQGVSAVR